MVPTDHSVRGMTAKGELPPPQVFERSVARSAVPPAHPGLAVQREQLAKNPGRPLDPASQRQLKRDAPPPTKVVKVMAPDDAGKKLQSPPVTGPDKNGVPRRDVTPVQPVVATPNRSPGEPAGKPERVPKPGWERNDQPGFPVGGETNPVEGAAVSGRTDAGRGRDLVARPELPPSARVLPAPGGVAGTARHPPVAREAAVIDSGRVRDEGRE